MALYTLHGAVYFVKLTIYSIIIKKRKNNASL